MKLIVNMNGTVNWDTTRQAAISCLEFASGVGDFGIGNEPQVVCAGCNRTLPTICMHLDHILPQNTHSKHMVGGLGTPVPLYQYFGFSIKPSETFEGTILGAVLTISKLLGKKPPSTPPPLPGLPKLPGVGKPPRRGPPRASKPDQFKTISNTISTEVAWKNDLMNLQFLCMRCNTSKQDNANAIAVSRPLGAFI